MLQCYGGRSLDQLNSGSTTQRGRCLMSSYVWQLSFQALPLDTRTRYTFTKYQNKNITSGGNLLVRVLRVSLGSLLPRISIWGLQVQGLEHRVSGLHSNRKTSRVLDFIIVPSITCWALSLQSLGSKHALLKDYIRLFRENPTRLDCPTTLSWGLSTK